MPDRDPRQAQDGDAPGDGATRDAVREDSDSLLHAVDRLRELEAGKRKVPMSTPDFHERADAIEDVARGVFGFAKRERVHGEQLGGTQAASIDDEAAADAPDQAGPNAAAGAPRGEDGA